MTSLRAQLLELKRLGLPLRKRNPNTHNLYLGVMEYSAFLPTTAKIKERIYVVLHALQSTPVCDCGSVVLFMGPASGYRRFCSTICSNKSVVVQKKKQETCSSNHGVRHPAQSQTIRTKMFDTTEERLGVRHSQQSPMVQTKTKATNIKNHGVESFVLSDIFKKKSKQTIQAKYGVDHISGVPAIQERKKRTLQVRYGVSHPTQIHLPTDAITKSNDIAWLTAQHHTELRSITDIANSIGYSPSHLCKIFHKHNITVIHHLVSDGEMELYNAIKNIIPNELVIQSDRTVLHPKELDIYIPALKIAFEYNGVYWHSELAGRDKTYHLNKTKLCASQGIHLVHIWDTEWIQQKPIVLSRIKHLLNQSSVIYARKCAIVSPSKVDIAQFMNECHIQGNVGSSVSCGLEYEGELVAVLTMGKSRFNKQFEYELLRFSNALNTCVVGGSSKLFKHFVDTHNPTNIITYSDKRWNRGELYELLGFQFSNNSTPNYFYFTPQITPKLQSRQVFQKHKLKNKLQTFDSKLTEWENMVTNGYNRIWDCGNDVYTWTKPQT